MTTKKYDGEISLTRQQVKKLADALEKNPEIYAVKFAYDEAGRMRIFVQERKIIETERQFSMTYNKPKKAELEYPTG